jgi:hypothetical protein
LGSTSHWSNGLEWPSLSAPPPAPGPLRPQLDKLVRSGLTAHPGPELGRGLLPQTPVGPLVVVVVAPRIQRGLDVDETQEPMLREALLAKPAIERLDQGIVPRSARPTEVELDPVPVGPMVQGPRGELGSVVDGDRRRRLALGGNPPEVRGNFATRKAGLGHQAEAFAGVGVAGSRSDAASAGAASMSAPHPCTAGRSAYDSLASLRGEATRAAADTRIAPGPPRVPGVGCAAAPAGAAPTGTACSSARRSGRGRRGAR